MPNLGSRFLHERRSIVVHLANDRIDIGDDELDLIHVVLEKEDDFTCILRGLKYIFPHSHLFVFASRKVCGKLRRIFKDVEFFIG